MWNNFFNVKKKMNILVTGSAGFIGFNLCNFLLKIKKYKITGIDNLNDYYDVNLKKKRNKILLKYKNYKFLKTDINNNGNLEKIFKRKKFDFVFHLAAQAGVRYSIDHPRKYVQSNIVGFFNIIENCKKYKVRRLFYASSSSVYGENLNFPLKENEKIFPKNIYGLTKKNNEEIAELFFEGSTTKAVGLRFFTVFGEWGRPDMLIYKYLKLVFDKKSKFYLNNYGNHTRDFTYINDVTEILYKLFKTKLKQNNNILNICSNNPIKITKILKFINNYFQKSPTIYKRTFQKADVKKTHGSNLKVKKFSGKKRFTDLNDALNNTCKWYSRNSKLFM